MSKFNKCGLALAIAGAMALPMAAMAATAGYPANTHNTYASNLFADSDAEIATAADYVITTTASDNIVGRTTGFGVRLILGNGVEFESVATPIPGAATTNYTAGTNAVDGNIAVFSMAAAAGANIGVGELLVFEAGDIVLENLGALVNGGSVPLTIELFDSNTATVFQTINGQALLSATEGVTVSFNAQAGDIAKRIDVSPCGANSAAGVTGNKTRFSVNGGIGESCNANSGSYVFNAGSISVGVTQVPVNGAPQYVLAAGTSTANVLNDNFAIVTGDEVDYTLTGTNFAPFRTPAGQNDNVYLSTDQTCASGTRTVQMSVSADGSSASGTRVRQTDSSAAEVLYACFRTTGNVTIDAQDISASAAVDFSDADVRDSGREAGDLLAMRYNGTVLQFQNVNPASNPLAQSFLRFTNNNSSFSCPVTLEGRDDQGVAGDSTIRFTLAAGQSMTINSEHLENGTLNGATGAFGNGAGRWVVTANAECASFVGSALNRNTDTGTVTNLTTDKR